MPSDSTLAASGFRMILRFASVCAIASTCLCAAVDRAAAAEKKPASDAPKPAPQRPAESDEKRPLPDYDGREEPTTAGDVLIWVPRVLLAPPYFVSEYLLRRPLGFVIASSERAGVPAFIYDFFTFGENHQAGIVPVAFYQFGFRPSVGLYTFWDDAFFEGHDLRLRGAWGGKDWLGGSFVERFHLGGRSDDPFLPGDVIELVASGLRRPDHAFFGIGPDTEQDDLVRYGMNTFRVSAAYDQYFHTRTTLRGEVSLRSVDFFRGGFGDDHTLEEAVASGELVEPSGYRRGYTVARSALRATFDSRPHRPEPQSGVAVQLGGSHASELRERGSYVGYGGGVGGYLDLNDLNRTLALRAGARFVDPVGDSTIPFTELVTLGGSEPLRGFFPNRLTDRSAIAADLSYTWPIWIWLDGSMHAEVGNVFGAHLSGFELEKLRWSGSIGVESAGASENPLQVMIGVGSETFERGGGIDSFRLVLGTTNGF
jgi:hypothetical protein